MIAWAALCLLIASCGDTEPTPSLGDGSLGVVEVAPWESIQIRSVNRNTGNIALLGDSSEQAITFAVEDYGPIHGFDIDLGIGLRDLCSPEGGMLTGYMMIIEEDVVGIVGTACSAAATGMAPLITEAGMVMISGSNTAPSLTSDLAGGEGENHYPGYYRTSHNDLVQGEATAHFLLDMGVESAAIVHDGDAYTSGLAMAFAEAFEHHEGTITGVWEVSRTVQDLTPVLTEIAEGEPQALFFPLLLPTGARLMEQVTEMPAFADTVFAAADALLRDQFMSMPESEGVYISGPDSRFEGNTNQSTGKSATELVARFEERTGQPPSHSFWGHTYDATVLLLDAIAAASHQSDTGSLVIDRAGLRQYLDNLSAFQGVSGVLSCDEFGDCGASQVVIHHHLDSTDLQATRDSVVFELGPNQRQPGESLTGH